MPSSCDYQPDGVHDNDVVMYQKRSRTITMEVDDPDNDLGDITDAKLWLSIKADNELADDDAIVMKKSLNNGGSDEQMKVVTATGTTKVVEAYLVPDDTDPSKNLEALPGDYTCDAVIELSGGIRLQLVDPFNLTLLRPTTLT